MKRKTKLKTIKTLFAIVIAIALNTNFALGQKLPTPDAGCTNTCSADAGANVTIQGGCCGIATLGGGNTQHPCANTCAVGGLTYSWTPSTGLSCTTCCHPTCTVGTTTTYTLTVSFTCSVCCCGNNGGQAGCSGTTCQTDIVNPKPPMALTGYCSGNVNRTSTVIVTVVPPQNNCCRLMNPNQQEVTSENIYLYPNPSSGWFTLSVYNTTQPVTINVFDINGNSVWGEIVDPNKIHIPIDLSSKAKGIYFIRVIAEDNILFFKKAIVQ